MTSAWSSAGRPGLDSPLALLSAAGMRAAAVIVGLCLAVPALGATGAGSACIGMTLPPEHLNYVSRGFGRGHAGLDLMAPFGSPIRAAGGGTVVYAGWYFAYGKVVDIRHAD